MKLSNFNDPIGLQAQLVDVVLGEKPPPPPIPVFRQAEISLFEPSQKG